MRRLLALVAALGALGPVRPALASPTAMMLPDGRLAAAAEDARFSVTPDQRVLPVEGLVSFLPPLGLPLDVLVEMPSSVAQGRAVSVLMASLDPLVEIRAVLRSPAGRVVAEARGFELPYLAPPAGPPALAPSAAWGPLPPSPRARAYAALLAVPAEGETGTWRVEVEGESGASAFRYAGRVEVVSGGYRSARIRLTPALTALRTRSDARAYRDQARLDAAIRSFSVDVPRRLEPWADPLGRSVRSAGYGDRRLYLYSDGSTATSVHRGTDLVAPAGTPVRATAAGRVVLAEDLLVSGRTVGVESLPGVVTFYFHLSSIQVTEGELVEQGQVVGRLGATGLATGAHLHWELRVSGVAVLPEPGTALVDKRAVFRIIAACESTNRQRR